MRIAAATAATDTGRKRRRNEDTYVLEPPLFAVADGMGGASAGELASGLAASALSEREGGESVAELVAEANRRIFAEAVSDVSLQGMGTTLTVALLDGATVRVGHVGDSRGYLFRDGVLEQLTEDHSLVAELVRSGRITAEEAVSHPQRSVITRALGTEATIEVDTFEIEGRDGDVFLLCSDGLTSMVPDASIQALLTSHTGDLETAARALVAAANAGGGEDNITVVAFSLTSEAEDTAVAPAEEAPEEDTLSGLEPVPVIGDPALRPPDRVDQWQAGPEASSPPPVARPRRKRRKRLRAFLVVLAVLLALAIAAALVGLSRAHFVGAQPDGHVAVYQGVPWDIGGGIRLYRTVWVSPLLVSQLTQAERRSLFDHTLRSESSARALVDGRLAAVSPEAGR